MQALPGDAGVPTVVRGVLDRQCPLGCLVLTEESVRLGEYAGAELVGDAVADDGEEPDVATRPVDLGDGRSRLRGRSICPNTEARDALLSSGMEGGMTEGYEKLDRLLAEL